MIALDTDALAAARASNPNYKPEEFIIRRCDGNRDAFGIFRRNWDPLNYGYCVTTANSVDGLLAALRAYPGCKVEIQP